MSITGPSQVGEGGIVQVADDAQWSLLLRVVDVYGILGGNSVYDPVWKPKRRLRAIRGRCCRRGTGFGVEWVAW